MVVEQKSNLEASIKLFSRLGFREKVSFSWMITLLKQYIGF
jgi:hypothetical protein